MKSERGLKAVVALLNAMAANGTMDRGQQEALAKAITQLRGAYRSHDPVRMRKAIDHVCRVFLRAHGR